MLITAVAAAGRCGPGCLGGRFGLYDSQGGFHGYVNNNPYDPDGIANPYGSTEGPYSPDSVNNGQWGSPYSPDSARNPYATGSGQVIPLAVME